MVSSSSATTSRSSVSRIAACRPIRRVAGSVANGSRRAKTATADRRLTTGVAAIQTATPGWPTRTDTSVTNRQPVLTATTGTSSPTVCAVSSTRPSVVSASVYTATTTTARLRNDHHTFVATRSPLSGRVQTTTNQTATPLNTAPAATTRRRPTCLVRPVYWSANTDIGTDVTPTTAAVAKITPGNSSPGGDGTTPAAAAAPVTELPTPSSPKNHASARLPSTSRSARWTATPINPTPAAAATA